MKFEFLFNWNKKYESFADNYIYGKKKFWKMRYRMRNNQISIEGVRDAARKFHTKNNQYKKFKHLNCLYFTTKTLQL